MLPIAARELTNDHPKHVSFVDYYRVRPRHLGTSASVDESAEPVRPPVDRPDLTRPINLNKQRQRVEEKSQVDR